LALLGIKTYIHLHMLEVAAEHGFKFDTAQLPLNVMDAHYRTLRSWLCQNWLNKTSAFLA